MTDLTEARLKKLFKELEPINKLRDKYRLLMAEQTRKSNKIYEQIIRLQKGQLK